MDILPDKASVIVNNHLKKTKQFMFVLYSSLVIFILAAIFLFTEGDISQKSLLDRVNEAGLVDPTNAHKILSGDFKDSRFPNDAAATKRNEYRIYDTQFDYLRTRYYAGDGKALILAKQWREMLKTQFPEMYAQSERLNPTAFEISEQGK